MKPSFNILKSIYKKNNSYLNRRFFCNNNSNINNNNSNNNNNIYNSNGNQQRNIKNIYKEINDTLKNSNNKLIAEGSELESRILLSHVLNLDSSAITLFGKKNQNRILSDEEYNKVQSLVNRRLSNEPINYLIGYRYFWKHKFYCDQSTLIPRPDSETIIEKILEEKNKNQLQFNRILDLGTGTGCLLLSILHECKEEIGGSFGVGIDKSKESLLLANRNASELELSGKVCFLNLDWNNQESLVKELDQFKPFDLVISNPPYISNNEYKELNQIVKDWEPKSALVSDDNGLQDYKNIGLLLKNHNQLLSDNALIVFEIGKDQDNDIIDIMNNYGFKLLGFKKDLSSIIRCLVFTKIK